MTRLKSINLAYILIYTYIIFFILMGVINSNILISNADMNFLYNRALQMYTCLQDGNNTFFYYNDFNGVGYGTSFFYGDITLYPFLIFINLGKRNFLLAYVITTLVLMQLGIVTLCKRFAENYKDIAILPLMSVVFITCLTKTGSYANYFAVALSLFFIAFSVDFFRDRKSFIPASLMFYLIINSHMITSLLCFIISVVFLVLYFDKTRLKDYLFFILLSAVLSVYPVANVLYHSDILNRQLEISSDFKYYFRDELYSINLFFADLFPFKGVLFDIILKGYEHIGFSYVNVGILLLGIFLCKSRKLSKRECVVLVLSVFLVILSLYKVWFSLDIRLTGWIQYPLRYAPYIVIAFILISFRYCDKKKLFSLAFLLCLFDLILLPSLSKAKDEYSEEITYEDQIMNGEYLDSSFIFAKDMFEYLSSTVEDEYGNLYDYTIDKECLYVNIDNHEDSLVVRFPKLYYKGYVLKSVETGETFDVEMGYSQFIIADIGDFSGELVLYYKHSDILVLLFALNIILVSVILLFYVSVFFSERQKDNNCKK